MPLRSRHFKDNPRLQACLVNHSAHVCPGSTGEHVQRIQHALISLDGCKIDAIELKTSHYGKTTADAVLSYKSKRSVINRSYQSSADNIVGKMTIAALDEEMLRRECETSYAASTMSCRFDHDQSRGRA